MRNSVARVTHYLFYELMCHAAIYLYVYVIFTFIYMLCRMGFKTITFNKV